MKKTIIILSSLGLVLVFAVSGFTVEYKENPLGSVIAVEREFVLSFAECQSNFKRKEYGIECNVIVVPDTGEEEGLSDSLENIDTTLFIKNNQYGAPIKAYLSVYNNSYEVYSGGTDSKEVTDAEFLDAARKLIDKFPKATVKLIKVAR